MEVLGQLLHVGLDTYVVTSGLTGRATVIYFGLVPLYILFCPKELCIGGAGLPDGRFAMY